MSLADRLGSAIGAANEASKSIKGIKDKVIVTATKGSTELQQSIKDSANGKKKRLEEDDIRANQRAAALQKLNNPNNVEEKKESENIEGMFVDSTRNNFDEIGEFNDMTMVKNIKVGSEIREWINGLV